MSRQHDLRQRAVAVTPGGAQTRSKRASAFPLGYPMFLRAGRGAYVWDEDGRRYIDWICGLASISLGYCYGPVDHAVDLQLRRGVSFSLPTALEVQVAEALRAMLPGADMVRFCKTGSEANEGVCRIARLATGRPRVISIGYHGWHTLQDAALPDPVGVPKEFSFFTLGMPMGTAAEPPCPPRQVAAVLIEVMRDEPPPPGYLDWWRQWTQRHGALLIFDEIVTGFRWAIGGASEYFSVQPDLATYGKGMANGFPLAAIVGRADLMAHATYVSGTFGGETVSLAACQATLDVFRTQPVIKRMWTIGDMLQAEFNGLMGRRGVDLRMTGYPVHPRIVGDQRDAFVAAVAQQGVLFHPAGFNVSFSHGEAQVRQTIEACDRALEAMA